MANHLVLLLFVLLALRVFDAVAATPVVVPANPILLSLPAGAPPPQSAEVLMEVCRACKEFVQLCHCMALNSHVNPAAYSQQQIYPPEQDFESAHSSAIYYTPTVDEMQSQPYSTLQQPESTSYYSQNPHSSSWTAYTNSQLSQNNAWVDTTYTPLDREDPRLGNYYQQPLSDPQLNSLIEFLASASPSPGPNPLDGPAGLDSASIDPQRLSLPMDAVDKSGVPEKCPYCPKSFAPRSLKRHIQRQHNPKIARYECEFPRCPFSSIKETDVDRHVRSVHAHEQPYGCEFCSKRFGRSDNMRRHVRTIHADLQ